jgi:hypothetical protein
MTVCKDLSPNPLPKVGGGLEDRSEAFAPIFAYISQFPRLGRGVGVRFLPKASFFTIPKDLGNG